MQVDFYQLTRDPADKVLPPIAQRVLDGNGRLLVVSGDAEQLDEISAALWSWKADSFLAHAKAGENDDALQPILLSSEPIAANQAKFVALADGKWRDEALDFERVFFLFPPDHLVGARQAWRALGERDDVDRRFWKQESGKWTQGP